MISRSTYKNKIRKELRRFKACQEQEWTCKYCFRPVTWNTVTLDHKETRPSVTCKRLGLSHVMFASCYDCNIRRGDMPFYDFVYLITSDAIEPSEQLIPIRERRKYYKDGDLSVTLHPDRTPPCKDRTLRYRVDVVKTFTAIMCGRAE